MTWARMFWLAIALAVLAGVALVLPYSPAYLPKLMTMGGNHNGHSTGYWIKKLDDPDVETRRSAIYTLGTIGPQAADSIPRLVQILREDHDGHTRDEAVEALGRMGPATLRALPDLTQAVEDRDPFVRMCAIRCLMRLKKDARPAVPVLIRALQDEHNKTDLKVYMQTIQEAAATALGFASADSDEAVAALRGALKGSPRAEMRGAVARALGHIGPSAKAAEPDLRALLKDDYDDVRLDAQEALVRLAGKIPVELRR